MEVRREHPSAHKLENPNQMPHHIPLQSPKATRKSRNYDLRWETEYLVQMRREYPPVVFRVPKLGFRVLWVSDFVLGDRVLGPGSGVSGCRVSGFGFRVSGLGFRGPGFGFRGFWFRVSCRARGRGTI